MPEMEILFAVVTPSLVLAPVSGLIPVMVGGPKKVSSGSRIVRRPAPRAERSAVREGDDGRSFRGRSQVAEAEAKGVVPRAKRGRVCALDLDEELLCPP